MTSKNMHAAKSSCYTRACMANPEHALNRLGYSTRESTVPHLGGDPLGNKRQAGGVDPGEKSQYPSIDLPHSPEFATKSGTRKPPMQQQPSSGCWDPLGNKQPAGAMEDSYPNVWGMRDAGKRPLSYAQINQMF